MYMYLCIFVDSKYGGMMFRYFAQRISPRWNTTVDFTSASAPHAASKTLSSPRKAGDKYLRPSYPPGIRHPLVPSGNLT